MTRAARAAAVGPGRASRHVVLEPRPDLRHAASVGLQASPGAGERRKQPAAPPDLHTFGDAGRNDGRTPPYLRRWRESIPFSDEQIAAALELEAAAFERDGSGYMALRRRWQADQVRAGWLSVGRLKIALPYLVRTCAICGSRALYRTGHEGRCSAHRLIRSKTVAARVARLEHAGTLRERQASNFDNLQLRRLQLHADKRRGRRK